jgi:hypothetical protein
MRLARPQQRDIFFALFALCLVGCGPPQSPVSVRVKEQLNGPPDLVKNGPWDKRWRAFQLHTFQMNHVWAGAGRPHEDGDYRLKLTVWDYSDSAVLAELYFHDGPAVTDNPDPNKSDRPYHLHFPATAMGPILQALRNANEPVYLYYYDNNWAFGLSAPEAIGVD